MYHAASNFFNVSSISFCGCFRYSVSHDNWTFVDDTPVSTYGMACAQANYNSLDSILCLDGLNNPPSLFVLDLTTETWSTSPASPPLPRRVSAKAFISGRILVFASGQDPDAGWTTLTTGIGFDLDAGVWESLPGSYGGAFGIRNFVVHEYEVYQRV